MSAGARTLPRWMVPYTLFVLWIYEGAFLPLLRAPVTDAKDAQVSDVNGRIANAIILVSIVAICMAYRKLLAPMLRKSSPALLLLAVCYASTLWSLYPFTTVRRALSLTTCFVFGRFCHARMGSRFIDLFGWSILVAAAASLLVVVVLPSRAYDFVVDIADASEGLHGVFSQKNELSVFALMGMCTWLYMGFLAPSPSRTIRLARVPALLLLLVTIMLSRGVTSMLATALVIMAALEIKLRTFPRLRLLYRFGLLAGISVLVAALLLDADALFHVLGKDSSLTGRVPLWTTLLHMFRERPMFGYGYGAFWNPESNLTQYVWAMVGWPAPNAHNGFLQLMLDVGLVGMSLFLLVLVRPAIAAFRHVSDPRCPEAKWMILVLIAMFVENLDEGTLAWPDALAMLVFYQSALATGLDERRQRVQVAIRAPMLAFGS